MMQHYKGQLITLEGIEGAGKSSIIPFLEEDLRKHGMSVVVTREPGGTPLAEKIRQLLLNDSIEYLDSITETLLIWAARRQHWLHTLVPALSAGTWVICDRFVDSSIAYQQHGRGVNADLMGLLNKETLGAYQPNLTLLFDIDQEESVLRMRQTGKKPDRIEQETREFFQRVVRGYRQLAQKQPRIVIIDGSRKQALVVDAARKALADFIRANKL